MSWKVIKAIITTTVFLGLILLSPSLHANACLFWNVKRWTFQVLGKDKYFISMYMPWINNFM